ncbi:MAG: hypothetical protein AAB876_01710 [Patescibacteria group bacterium]
MNIPFFSNKKQKEFYLGIFLKESQGIVMIFLRENDRLELVDREKFSYTNGWENLTNDVDEALYKLEKNLDIEIKKTIIFVYSHLVDEKIGDIKPVYLQKIKQLIKALDLKPMGYIECFEAISFYLQKEDQILLTAILIEIDKTQLGIFTYKGGRIESKIFLSRTDNIIADLTEGFEEIKKKSNILPPRIILYDSGNLDDTAAKILGHRWSSDFFIQIPKVDILSEDEVVNGLMNIFGEQIKNETSVKKEEYQDRENFGFMINEDIGEKAIYQNKNILPKTNWKNKIKDLTSKLLVIKINFSGKIFMMTGILIIILGLFINEYFFHQAQLTVYLPTQILEKNIKLDIDYRLASASADFSETINTTGKQEVGDKARGQVTVYNSNLSSSETLSKGTSIISPNNLKYFLESEVKVASATGDASSPQPSTIKVTVVATEIGEGYNLTAGTKFIIGGKSNNLLAKNDSALLGGSKKQIQTVSKKDQEDLRTAIVNKAKKEIPSIKVLPDEAIASFLSATDFNKTIFSKEIGEESSKLTLQATVYTTQYLYNKKLFIDKILVSLKPEVKNDYRLEKENIAYTINKISRENKSLKVDAKIKAKAVINISTDEIKKSILGKNQSKIKEILKSQYKIEGYNLNISEPLPFLNNYLPFFLKNIILKNSSL